MKIYILPCALYCAFLIAAGSANAETMTTQQAQSFGLATLNAIGADKTKLSQFCAYSNARLLPATPENAQQAGSHLAALGPDFAKLMNIWRDLLNKTSAEFKALHDAFNTLAKKCPSAVATNGDLFPPEPQIAASLKTIAAIGADTGRLGKLCKFFAAVNAGSEADVKAAGLDVGSDFIAVVSYVGEFNEGAPEIKSVNDAMNALLAKCPAP